MQELWVINAKSDEKIIYAEPSFEIQEGDKVAWLNSVLIWSKKDGSIRNLKLEMYGVKIGPMGDS